MLRMGVPTFWHFNAKRQKTAPNSPSIGHRASAALLSRELGDRRAIEGDCAPHGIAKIKYNEGSPK